MIVLMTFQVDSPGTVLISTLLDILALDILGLDILGLDILGLDILGHFRQETYPGGAAGMLTGSPQRECCGQEHAGRECPHKRSGGC